MEELPECPVCLQPYDAISTIPRVLACGHTTCQSCLTQLPNPFPQTIRCPSCTQLVKFPTHNPSLLPKNIDLLHFAANTSNQKEETSASTRKQVQNPVFLIPKLWSHEFYQKWKPLIIPKETISVEESSNNNNNIKILFGSILQCFSGRFVLKEGDVVSLVKVGVFDKENHDDCAFEYSYEAKILLVLHGMSRQLKDEMGLVLNASLRCIGVTKALGFWYNADDHCVYLVSQRLPNSEYVLRNGFLNLKSDEGNVDKMRSFGMIGLRLCEAVHDLHKEGLMVGFFTTSCFSFDVFGRTFVDLSEVLVDGSKLYTMISNALSDKDLEMIDVFVSPEILMKMLREQGIELGCENFTYEAGFGSDVWWLSCVLSWLLIGEEFLERMHDYVKDFVSAACNGRDCNLMGLYIGWTEIIINLLESKLGSEFEKLEHILSNCFFVHPGNRPAVTEVWECLRGMIIKPEFDISYGLKLESDTAAYCIVLGEMCQVDRKTNRILVRDIADGLHKKDENSGIAEPSGLSVKRGIVEGISEGHVKCIDLKGHVSTVTGLAVGGGFLFSSSIDKVVHVWSLQDFAHVQAFRGHEEKVMAVAYVDGVVPLCISGDYGGIICIWKASVPFNETPIKKMDEQKDWRYSGIHALAVSGTEYFYTGSGDKSIKAWSLQDYSLSCTMNGHNSIVSSLAVCNGVLYSGSWDGTVRLWCLSDHTPLTVLGPEEPGSATSVLSLAADTDVIVVTHENGSVKFWCNDVIWRSDHAHKGAVFSLCKIGKYIFTGGWDKTVNVQELSGDDQVLLDSTPIGSIACDAVITALAYWQGTLLVGQADRVIKVYYYGE